jgi:hypothetical protein
MAAELPEDWRSATDPNTGRTYWYHRKTRVSTWVKPNFIGDSNAEAAVPISSNSALLTNPESSKPKNTSKPIELGILRFRPTNNLEANDRSLKDLFIAISTTSADELSDNSTLLSDLVNFVINTQPKSSRIAALKCIWKLSLSRIIATTAFQLNQSWNSMWMFISRWEDLESVILLSAIHSNLCIGPSYGLIGQEAMDTLSSKLEDVVEKNNPADLKSSVKAISIDSISYIIEENALGWYTSLAQYGHELPAWLILVVATAALK